MTGEKGPGYLERHGCLVRVAGLVVLIIVVRILMSL